MPWTQPPGSSLDAVAIHVQQRRAGAMLGEQSGGGKADAPLGGVSGDDGDLGFQEHAWHPFFSGLKLP